MEHILECLFYKKTFKDTEKFLIYSKSYKTVIVRFAFAQAVPMSDSKLQSSKILQ